MGKLDDTNAIEVAEGIWWIGFADYEAGFSNNPYLLIDEDEAILFDPGPGHPFFRDLIFQKIDQITDLEKIRYLVVHHQDPDLCGLIPFIENSLHPDLVIAAHPRSALFIPYYGVRKGILPIGDGDVLELKSGRRIAFHHAPYLHFAGNMMSFDEKTASLFSSDIFAVFSREWDLYADDKYVDLARDFIEHYVSSKEPVEYAYDKIIGLNAKRILPQHGGIIEKDIDKFLDMLKDVEPGQLLRELNNKPTPEQSEILLKAGKDWLRYWLKKDIDAESLDDLMSLAMEEGPSSVSLLIDSIAQKAQQLEVANPLAGSRVHKWDSIWSSRSTLILESLRRRFLTRQYGMRHGEDSDTHATLQQGLQAFKTNVGVMMVDIRGFTRWSADRPPDEVVSVLERELELITRIIQSHGGRVNKILGDGVLAYFPERRLSDCVEVAIEIQKAIEENNMLPIGVGCDFGEVIMGDLGHEARVDYTLIGAVVNFASRMCDTAGRRQVALTTRVFDKLSDEVKASLETLYSTEKIQIKLKPSDPEVDGVLLTLGD